MENKESKFMTILKRDNATIKDERAVRIAQSTKEAQIKLILDKKAEVVKIESELEGMLDLSTSPDTTTDVALREFDHESFVINYQTLQEKLEVKKLKLEAALKTGRELFNIDIDKLS